MRSILFAGLLMCFTGALSAQEVLVHDNFSMETSDMWHFHSFASPPVSYSVETTIEPGTGDTLRDTTWGDSVHVPYGMTGHGHFLINTSAEELQFNPRHTGFRHRSGWMGYRDDFVDASLSAPTGLSVYLFDTLTSVLIEEDNIYRPDTVIDGSDTTITDVVDDTRGLFVLIRYRDNDTIRIARSTTRLISLDTIGLDTLTYYTLDTTNLVEQGTVLDGTARDAALGEIVGVGLYYVTSEVFWAAGAIDLRIGGFALTGEVDGPPTVTMNPASITIVAGDTVDLEASIVGTPTIRFQWFMDGTEIVDATERTHTFGTTLADTGVFGFTLQGTRANNTVETDTGWVTVVPADDAHIYGQPESVSITRGVDAAFQVNYGDIVDGPLVAQWYHDSIAVGSGTTSPDGLRVRNTLTITAATDDDAGSYFCVVTGRTGVSVVSDTVTLTVTDTIAPTILAQPEDYIITSYTTNSQGTISVNPRMTIGVEGSGPLTVVWRLQDTDSTWRTTGYGDTVDIKYLKEEQVLDEGLKICAIVSNPFDTVYSDTVVIRAEITGVVTRTRTIPTELGLSARPQFGSGLALQLGIPAAACPVVNIYSVRGELVRSLLDGSHLLAAGTHALSWDGRNGAGRAIAQGTYICRVTSDKRVVSTSLHLVR